MKNRSSGGRAAAGEQGFSLIELTVALVITLIISGAIYGLIATGQSSFRREPEVAERQQNIRVAMDMIQRDIAITGVGMTPFSQVFSDSDVGGPLNSAGPAAFPAVIDPAATAGENSDILEMFGNDGSCPDVSVVLPGPPPSPAPVAGNNIRTSSIPSCYPEDWLYFIEYPAPTGTVFGIGFNIKVRDTEINFPPGQQLPAPYKAPTPPLNGPGNPRRIGVLQMARYQVSPDPSDGAPALWRSPTGGYNPSTAAYAAPPGPNWQLVARGIEDLQVSYRVGAGAGVWQDRPGVVIVNNYDSIVRQVRVTLSARALAAQLAGQTTSAQGSAIRGQLTSVGVPRAALLALSNAPAPVPWQ